LRERVYAKTGASTRTTATLFAMRHGLLDTPNPINPLLPNGLAFAPRPPSPARAADGTLEK
jgi:hypothetical protein